MNRSSRSALTFASSGLLSVITLLIGFFAARLLVNWLGAETLGIYTAANGWLGQLSLLELGVASAMLPLMARASGKESADEIRDVLATSFASYRRVAALCIAGGGIILLSITHLIRFPADRTADVRFGLMVGMLSLFLMPLMPLRALIDARQRGYFLNVILLFQSLMITGLGLLAARLRWGVTGQFMAAAAGTLFFTLSLVFYCRRQLPDLFRIFFRPAPAQFVAEMRKLNKPALVCGICGKLGLFTDNLLIAYYLGPAAVIPFIYTQRLCVMGQSQLQAIGGSTWAALSELYFSGRLDLFRHRVVQLTRIIATLGCAAMIPIVAFNHVFFRMWQPSLPFAGESLTIFASINAIALGLMTLWGWIFTGMGKVAELSRIAVVGVAVNLALSIAATRAGHIYGPVFGSTVGMGLLQLLWMPWLMRKNFGISPAQICVAVLMPVLLVLPFMASTVWWARLHPPQHWITLTMEMTFAPMPYLVCAWMLVMNVSEREMVWERLVHGYLRRRSTREGPPTAAVAAQVPSTESLILPERPV